MFSQNVSTCSQGKTNNEGCPGGRSTTQSTISRRDWRRKKSDGVCRRSVFERMQGRPRLICPLRGRHDEHARRLGKINHPDRAQARRVANWPHAQLAGHAKRLGARMMIVQRRVEIRDPGHPGQPEHRHRQRHRQPREEPGRCLAHDHGRHAIPRPPSCQPITIIDFHLKRAAAAPIRINLHSSIFNLQLLLSPHAPPYPTTFRHFKSLRRRQPPLEPR